jgi:hypothetical protein
MSLRLIPQYSITHVLVSFYRTLEESLAMSIFRDVTALHALTQIFLLGIDSVMFCWCFTLRHWEYGFQDIDNLVSKLRVATLSSAVPMVNLPPSANYCWLFKCACELKGPVNSPSRNYLIRQNNYVSLIPRSFTNFSSSLILGMNSSVYLPFHMIDPQHHAPKY